jgi:hypothetical protein
MRVVSVSILRAALTLSACAALGWVGCAGQQTAQSASLPKQLLSGESGAPALFMSAEPSSPVVGFLGKDVTVDVAGPSVSGRVPVRVHGAILVRGYVPENLLALRAQRHGKVRGTPVYLAANDPVRVLGEDREAGRLKVRVTPQIDGVNLPAFEGSYPSVGITASPVDNAEPPPAGEAHELASGSALPLYLEPDGALITELPARSEPLSLEVLGKQGVWSAVRLGRGPYLVGYTNAYLTPSVAPPAAKQASAAAKRTTENGVPARLVSESGELKRVAAGAAISFGDRVFAKLQKPGYARVLATYPSGEADALVAVDDDVAVRGLLRGSDLSAPEAAAAAIASDEKQARAAQ